MPVRDQGLLESALARPRASAFERDAYASLNERAAALTHSLARNHGLIDGNIRLSLAAVITFLSICGFGGQEKSLRGPPVSPLGATQSRGRGPVALDRASAYAVT